LTLLQMPVVVVADGFYKIGRRQPAMLEGRRPNAGVSATIGLRQSYNRNTAAA
jgi:hypothetical protein